MSKLHEVKCFEDRFYSLSSEDCKADIRLNDREYQKGDLLKLKEGFNSLAGFMLTGRYIICQITHVSNYGLKEGFVALSLQLLSKQDDKVC